MLFSWFCHSLFKFLFSFLLLLLLLLLFFCPAVNLDCDKFQGFNFVSFYCQNHTEKNVMSALLSSTRVCIILNVLSEPYVMSTFSTELLSLLLWKILSHFLCILLLKSQMWIVFILRQEERLSKGTLPDVTFADKAFSLSPSLSVSQVTFWLSRWLNPFIASRVLIEFFLPSSMSIRLPSWVSHIQSKCHLGNTPEREREREREREKGRVKGRSG